MSKFLDETGLGVLVKLIKKYVNDNAASVTVDDTLSSTSTNPVQNKVINTALAGKLSTSGTAAKATADASGNVITSTYAKLASPTFTGTPTAPTATAGTSTTQIATTAFVMAAIAAITNGNEVAY